MLFDPNDPIHWHARALGGRRRPLPCIGDRELECVPLGRIPDLHAAGENGALLGLVSPLRIDDDAISGKLSMKLGRVEGFAKMLQTYEV